MIALVVSLTTPSRLIVLIRVVVIIMIPYVLNLTNLINSLMNEQYFVQTCGMSLDSLDSEVVSLIEDLGLVLKGSAEHLAWLTVLENSRYRLYPFCARYHDRQKELHENIERLKTDLYRRNRKYSKFSYEDLSCVPLLFLSEKPLPVDVSKE